MAAKSASARSGTARKTARPKPNRLVGTLPARRLLSHAQRQNGAGAALPIHVRATQGLNPIERDYVRNRLGEKLRKHARSIERISVRVEDMNGPRGGVDQACRVKVVLTGLPSVVVETRSAKLSDAVDAAVLGIERAVRRSLERRREKPLRRGGPQRLV
jgi:ribosome-associated translation inhibitor RaiA